jgi:hypothetical protein
MIPFHVLERVGVRVQKKVQRSVPLTSLLSHGGERKITGKGIHRKIASPSLP